MNFLQIGLGSMGRRRIRNLIANGVKKDQIFGFDRSINAVDKTKKELGIQASTDLKKIESLARPDAYIISTAPDNHIQFALRAARKKKHFFTEIGVTDAGYDKLMPLLKNNFVAAPSCTFRYNQGVKILKKVLRQKNVGKVLSFQYHVGQYLPDWHPWEDYRKTYFAQKKTGGCREILVYELIWLCDLLGGTVKKISGVTEKISALPIAADDVYAAGVKLKNSATGTILVDLLARTPVRSLRIMTENSVIEWNWLDYAVRQFDLKNKKWKKLSVPKGRAHKGYTAAEEMYVEEIKYFLQAVNGKKQYSYSFKEDWQYLRALKALEIGIKSL